jgi:hypothetical protein
MIPRTIVEHGVLERLIKGNNRPAETLLRLLKEEYESVGIDPQAYENFLTSGHPNVRVVECDVLPYGTHD